MINTRIQGLDVLRGLAALTVVLSHYLPFWDRNIGGLPFVLPNAYGYYAVQLFFVISGIVIFNTLDKCRSVAHFAYLRFSRLYPAYWASLYLVVFASIAFFDQSLWLGGLVTNTTMFQEFIGFKNIDNVYWSLTAELAFYVHVAWLFALGWHKRVALVCAIWLIVTCVWALTSEPRDEISRIGLVLYFNLDVSAYFVMGMLLYDAVRRGVGPTTWALAASALFTLTLVSGLEGLLVGSVTLALCWLATFNRLGLLVNRVTLWLGSISYSLYLVHRNLGYLLLPRLAELGLGPLPAILLCVTIMLALAHVLMLAVERPALRLLRNAWKSRH